MLNAPSPGVFHKGLSRGLRSSGGLSRKRSCITGRTTASAGCSVRSAKVTRPKRAVACWAGRSRSLSDCGAACQMATKTASLCSATPQDRAFWCE